MKKSKSNGRTLASRFALALVMLTLGFTADAEEPNLGALKAQGAQRLPKDELTVLLTGASLTREVERGEIFINTQKDGSLNARYQSKMRSAKQLKGYGTWKVSDDGKYCLDIKWERGFEDVSGCRDMYKAGEEYYGAGSNDDDAKLYHYKISK
jgi:Protein of unknown function (DUF995)